MLGAIRGRLQDADSRVRLAAVKAAAELGDPQAGPDLLGLLLDPEAATRRETVRAAARWRASTMKMLASPAQQRAIIGSVGK